MKKVNVLMSTYNGDRFLDEQICSIYNQKGVDISLLVRDDGSTDSTHSILDKQKKHGFLCWYSGENLGPAKSFMTLLRDSIDADYYAFSDQDDYWNDDKLVTAVEMLDNVEDRPALYFSRTQLTDAHLNPIGIVKIDPYLTFGESLVYEFVPGCTIVMNKRLRDIVNEYIPVYIPMHDVWVYSVALAIGARIFFDRNTHILYRQHGNNTIGQGYSNRHEWHRRIDRFTHSEHSRYRRASEIRRGFEQYLNDENSKILSDFISAKNSVWMRLKLCRDHRFDCANIDTRRLFNIALLLNTY